MARTRIFVAGSAVAILSSLLLACGHEAQPPVAPTGGEAAARTSPAPASTKPPPETAGTISISDEIRRACGISDEDAYFAFDSARIDPHAQSVLGQLATCFKSGPLAGRHMRLVGRADPRGEPEYNMVLGGRRASAVKDTLVELGLTGERISSTSRGAMDAMGKDEPSWAKDRRVDVLLGS